MKIAIQTLIATSVLSLLVGTAAFYSQPKTEIEVIGKFYGNLEMTDSNGNEDTYYQFRSNDNEVWWVLTKEEIGHIPNGNTEYILTYNNNGTTKENKPCDCGSEIDCECEVYDDEFISVAIKTVK